jgi:surface antigen
LAASVSPANATSVQPALLNANYTVQKNNQLSDIAKGLALAINNDSNFKNAGGSAASNSATVTISYSSPITWGTPFAFKPAPNKANPTETVQFAIGPPAVVTIVGSVQSGDSITIAAMSASGTTKLNVVLPVPPPAAVQGLAQSLH